MGRGGGPHLRTERTCATPNCSEIVLAGNSRKRCDTCQDVSYRASQSKYRKKSWQDEKKRAKQQAAYKASPKNRKKSLAQLNLESRCRLVGITTEEYYRLVDLQHGMCAMGGCDRTKLVIDHCHSTGKIRGLLCSPHNSALGVFGDCADGLRLALAYLEGLI